MQTHDSITLVCDSTHPNLEEGIDNVFKVMRRPVVCRGRRVHLGIEADVAVNLAYNVHTVHNLGDVESWLKTKFLAA